MSRKDFQLIAETLRGEIETARSMDEPHGVIALEGAARRFARILATTNPRFDGHRFLAACSVEV